MRYKVVAGDEGGRIDVEDSPHGVGLRQRNPKLETANSHSLELDNSLQSLLNTQKQLQVFASFKLLSLLSGIHVLARAGRFD